MRFSAGQRPAELEHVDSAVRSRAGKDRGDPGVPLEGDDDRVVVEGRLHDRPVARSERLEHHATLAVASRTQSTKRG
jgi:hypothetical protein